MGSLRITPKKKGETKVKVKDNITNETEMCIRDRDWVDQGLLQKDENGREYWA